MGALVEDKYDSDGHDKKRTTGQILWIRGLTRLQTQVGRAWADDQLWFHRVSLFFSFLPPHLINNLNPSYFYYRDLT